MSFFPSLEALLTFKFPHFDYFKLPSRTCAEQPQRDPKSLKEDFQDAVHFSPMFTASHQKKTILKF